MEYGSVTWIVAADPEEARVFCECVRTGALKELPELRMTSGRGEHLGQPVSDHAGHEADLRFVRRIAARLALEAVGGAYDRLALMGAPRTLGLLKLALPADVVKRVDVTDPHERMHEEAETLRSRLSAARARTWSQAEG